MKKCGNSAKKYSSNSTSTSSTRTPRTISSSQKEETIEYHHPKFRRGSPDLADNLKIWKMTRDVNFKAHGMQIMHNKNSSPRLYATKKQIKLQRQIHARSKTFDFPAESIGSRTEAYKADDTKRFINGQPKIFQGIMLRKRMTTLDYSVAEKDDNTFSWSGVESALDDIYYNCSHVDLEGTKLDINRAEDYIELFKFYSGRCPSFIDLPYIGGTNTGRFWKNAREFRSEHPNHPKREFKEAEFILVPDQSYPIPNKIYPGSPVAPSDDGSETIVGIDSGEESLSEESTTELQTIKTVTEVIQTIVDEGVSLNKTSIDTTDSEDSHCQESIDPPSEFGSSDLSSNNSTPDAVKHVGPKRVLINITPQEEVDAWSDNETEGYSYLPYATELPESDTDEDDLSNSASIEHVLTGVAYTSSITQETPKAKSRSRQQTKLLIKKIESVAITGQLYNSHEIEILREALDKTTVLAKKWRHRAETKSIVVTDMSCKLSAIHDTLSNVLKARGLRPLDFFVDTGDSDHPHVKNGQHIHVTQIDFTQNRDCPGNPPCEMKNTTMCVHCEMLFTNSAIMAMILAVFGDNDHSIKRFIPGCNYGFGEPVSGELELTQIPFPNIKRAYHSESNGNLAKASKLDDSMTVMYSPDDIGILDVSQSTKCNSASKSVVDTTIDDRTTQDFDAISIFDSESENEWFDALN